MKNEKLVKINLIIDVSSVCPSPEKGNLFALNKGLQPSSRNFSQYLSTIGT